MEYSQHPPRRLFLIGLAAVVGLIAVVALVAFLLVGSGKHQNTALLPNEPVVPRIATTEEVKQSLSNLDASLKQSAADQASASAAIKDTQVKVSG